MQGETIFKLKVMRDMKKLPNLWLLKTQERARKGVPDILACVNGKFVAIELKVRSKEATPLQARVLGQIQSAGGIGFATDPDSWATHYERIKEIAA